MSKYVYTEKQLPTPENSKLLALVGDNKNVLEVGCALGYQTRSLQEVQKCTVTGIEIDPDAACHARPFCEELIVGDIETLDLDDVLEGRKFDVITFADVLEHLRNPAATLSKVKSLIAPQGYLVASIPNIAHSSVIYELARGRFNYRSLGLLDETHIRFFTHRTIYETFEQAGYQIVSVDRNCFSGAETEFETRAETDEDRQLLNYIMRHNDEYETYQFIVKAISLADNSASQTELVVAQENIRLLSADLDLQRKKIRKLESDIDWIRSRSYYRALSKLKRLIGK